MKKILVFTLNGCVHCQELKEKLTELSIPFDDVEITLNRKLWDYVISQTGYDLLPTVFIKDGNDGSGLIYTPGRDFQSNDEIIKIIKNQYMEKGE
jgi:glutaredoxin